MNRYAPTGRYAPLAERLDRKLARQGECIVWTGHRTAKGYGQIGVNMKPTYTHRVAWELARGPVPNGLCVLHRCDNPPCCNVEHLFLGTKGDNNRDMVAKGRHSRVRPRGQAHHATLLTLKQAAAIRAEHAATGATYQHLADKYGVSRQCITRLIQGKTYTDGAHS